MSPSFRADAALQDALSRAASQGLEIEQHAPKGAPADALIGVADETGAELIVIGNVGMQGPKRIFGSVPDRVAHRSNCDVLIVYTKQR